MDQPTHTDRDMLRHMLATLAYRGGKAIRNAPLEFGTFRAQGAFNTPVAVLTHINDLIDWADHWCRGEQKYSVSKPQTWDEEVKRFHRVLEEFDRYLGSGQPLHAELEALFQAPIADALTHVGQIALLRRLAGDPVAGEAYRQAEIVAGRLGPDQAKPGREFERDKGAFWIEPKT